MNADVRLSSRRTVVVAGASLALLLSACVFYYATRSSSPSSSTASQLHSRSKKVDKQPKQEEVVVTGYRNIGNTCWLNCILQALASLPAFGVYLRELLAYTQAHQQSTLPNDVSLPSSLSASVLSPSLWSGAPSSLFLVQQFLSCYSGQTSNPALLYRALTAEATQFRGFQQNDSHELFVAIMEKLQARVKQDVRPSQADACTAWGWEELARDLQEKETAQHWQPVHKEPEESKEQQPDEQPATVLMTEAEEERKEAKAAPAVDGFSSTRSPPACTPAVSVSSLRPHALPSPLPPPPSDPFLGLLAQFLICKSCRYKSPVSHSAFNTVSLPLPRQSGTEACSLYTCLLAYCSAEEVQGVRCAMCSAVETRKACSRLINKLRETQLLGRRKDRHDRLMAQLADIDRRLVELQPSLAGRLPSAVSSPASLPTDSAEESVLFSAAVARGIASAAAASPAIAEHVVRRSFFKRIIFARLPKLLCLHLNRLCGDRKLTTRVHFPLVLSLAMFTAQQQDYALYPRRDGAADSAVFPASPHCLYRLCSVVCHHGGSGSGHYTCYRRHDRYKGEDGGGEKVWVHVSDDAVRRVGWDEVEACEAYMLYYERAD